MYLKSRHTDRIRGKSRNLPSTSSLPGLGQAQGRSLQLVSARGRRGPDHMTRCSVHRSRKLASELGQPPSHTGTLQQAHADTAARPGYLQAAFIEGSGSIGDPFAAFQRGPDAGMVLPPLEFSEWAQIRILVVQANLKFLHLNLIM